MISRTSKTIPDCPPPGGGAKEHRRFQCHNRNRFPGKPFVELYLVFLGQGQLLMKFSKFGILVLDFFILFDNGLLRLFEGGYIGNDGNDDMRPPTFMREAERAQSTLIRLL